jgi:hypothetical protein
VSGAAESPTARRYSVGLTELSALLADPAAKAVLERRFPGLSANERFSGAGDMTLRALAIFAPELFTSEALATADAELSRLTAPAGPPAAARRSRSRRARAPGSPSA